jgi:hypothetical protein
MRRAALELPGAGAPRGRFGRAALASLRHRPGGRPGIAAGGVDWIATNPPFKDLELWVEQAHRTARLGFALLCRSAALESVDRFKRVFRPLHRELLFAQYAERVAMVEGRCDPRASSATSYGWLVCDKRGAFRPLGGLDPMAQPIGGSVTFPAVLIPPCRARFERPGDWSVRWRDPEPAPAVRTEAPAASGGRGETA